MDSQWNSLLQSYNSNYVQYKVTGNQKYKNSYISAQEGLDSILSQIKGDVDSGKAQMSAFYKSGVEQKIMDLQLRNRKLQRGIVSEKDDIAAAKIRNEHPASTTSPSSITTSQYIAIGVLGVTLAGLSFL
jgi:DNA primase large subunit